MSVVLRADSPFSACLSPSLAVQKECTCKERALGTWSTKWGLPPLDGSSRQIEPDKFRIPGLNIVDSQVDQLMHP